MNILYLSDDKYAIYMGISILSLLVNNKDLVELNIYVIDDSISQINKDKIINMVSQYDRNIMFLNSSEGIKKLKNIGVPLYRGSYTTYLKIFTFGLLPDNVHKILFIDSDTLVLGSLKNLNEFDMSGNPIAAVLDNLSVFDKKYLGYEQDSIWCNMGVMLVNVDLWKDLCCENLIVNQMYKRCAYVSVDQNLLNISLHKRIAILPLQYNLTQHFLAYSYKDFMKCFPMESFYTKPEVEYAINNPIILHFERFIGESPWHKNNITLVNDEFDYYLRLSPWKNYVKKKAQVGLLLKLEKILFKLLPRTIFLKIYKLCFRYYIFSLNKKLESGIHNISI